MSRLTDLLKQARELNSQLAADLEAEVRTLNQRRTFGLVFEPHQPEAVQLPNHPVRKGNKVRVLPARGETARGDQRLWRVQDIDKAAKQATLVEVTNEEPETQQVSIADLVVVAEFRDTIYPGLVETGRIERGGDKPFHTVINAENYHALEMLTYTHRHRVDAIYIDPPYNTGAKDWKYNNDYVAADDDYRHSKWLAFMERRLKIARELLNPENSVLIVTIDEKEYLRLGLLLEQTFPEARIQMVSTAISPSGASREQAFRRNDEYIFFLKFGCAAPAALMLSSEWQGSKGTSTNKLRWNGLMRSGTEARRVDRESMFYPVFVNIETGKLHSVGEPLPLEEERKNFPTIEGTIAIWPIRRDGTEGRWQISSEALRKLFEKGYAKLGEYRGEATAISYLKSGEQKKLESGVFGEFTFNVAGHVEAQEESSGYKRVPTTQWSLLSHSAADHGTTLLRAFIPERKFPFPKSLYAVEDTLRFFVKEKPEAIILDFFSGSGTTAHAVMRLNRQDGGRRQCISITNNEVGADEQRKLLQEGLRPGDPDWEQWGIYDYITKPRIKAAITGETPEGQPIQGDYKFTDEFPMAEGFQENAAFFTLTYESSLRISHHKAFERIAPLLWLRAGAEGRIITDLGNRGWDVSERYAVLENLDAAQDFLNALKLSNGLRVVYIVTDNDAAFQMMCRDLPKEVTSVRLYESYLQNFQINSGRMG